MDHRWPFFIRQKVTVIFPNPFLWNVITVDKNLIRDTLANEETRTWKFPAPKLITHRSNIVGSPQGLIP